MSRAKFSLMGEGALLCDFSAQGFDEQTQARLWATQALLQSEKRIRQTIVGMNSLLASFDAVESTPGSIETAVSAAWEASEATRTRGAEHDIEVQYGGPDTDLDDVAATLGLTAREVIALHVAPEYRVAVIGFMPGWGYLSGLDERLALPRRSGPRARVPAGTVLMATDMSAVMPLASPTGWHVLGRTERTLFSLDREPHCLLACGDRVRFREVAS